MIPVFAVIENFVHYTVEEVNMGHEEFAVSSIHVLQLAPHSLNSSVGANIGSTTILPNQATIGNKLFSEDSQTN